MLAKQLAIGSGPGSLVSYLFGPGRHNEHADQRLVAASSLLIAGYEGVDLAGDREARAALAREFDGAWRRLRREQGLPLNAGEADEGKGSARADRVFHAMLSLGPEEGRLSEQQWAQAARMFVAEMGFIDADGQADCAWMAVHHGTSQHGNDHVHIAVSLVRDDGRRASVHQSKRRTAQAGARVAGALGKDAVFDAELSSGIGNMPRAEWERSQREQRAADRVLIRRRLAAAALGADNEAQFVHAARSLGVLVRPRFSKGKINLVEGYSAALAGAPRPIWFAPSKLDRSLGLPVLRERYGWDVPDQMRAIAVWRELGTSHTGADHLRLPVVNEVARARQHLVSSDPQVHWRRAAHDASAILGAWSVHATDSRADHLGRASDALAKAAQQPRHTSRDVLVEGTGVLIAVTTAAREKATGQLALLTQMMQLVDSMTRLAEARKERALTSTQLQHAMAPLQAEAKMLRLDVREEQIAAMDDESRQAMLTALGDPRRTPPPKSPPTPRRTSAIAPARRRLPRGRDLDQRPDRDQ